MSKHKKHSYKSYKTKKQQHNFRDAPTVSASRSSFNRSHSSKTTFDEGMLVPIYVDEVLPGDTFNLEVTAFIRMATPIAPIFDNLRFTTYFFFVPNRLVWDNWKRFCGETRNTGDVTDYEVPTLTDGPHTFATGSIYDYLGLPTQVPVKGSDISVLALRAGVQVYNDWFRPEFIQNMLHLNTGDGPDGPEFFEVERACKVHDYFTSGLPFAQKGEPVPIPTLGPDSIDVITTLDREASKYAAWFYSAFGDDPIRDDIYLGAANDMNTVFFNRTPHTTDPGFAPTVLGRRCSRYDCYFNCYCPSTTHCYY